MPELHVTGHAVAGGGEGSTVAADGAMLSSRGWFTLHDVEQRAADLARGVERLAAAGLPAICLYAFDEAWTLGQRLRDAISAQLDESYVLVEDVWAFRIPRGQRGWPPHRGIASLLDRARPQYVNVWVALSDAGLERSCMHLVSLTDDPSYPYKLDATDLPSGDGATARYAAPLPAGSALAWNANTLHWGGRCDARAEGPRISCTFSLCRADAIASMGAAVIDPMALDPWARMDIIARQVLVYGDGQDDISDAMRAWAKDVAVLATRMHGAPSGADPK